MTSHSSAYFSQAVMIVADAKCSLQITGNGDVLEPFDGIIGAQRSRPLLHARPPAVARTVFAALMRVCFL